MQRAQGLPSSSSNSDLEAMKSAHNAAISSNEKIFPIFAKKLASRNVKEYASTIRKLTTWLGSEKAYYSVARPKIVELLEIALSVFRDTFVHHSAIAQFAELLRQLVQAVIPFIHLFSEAELQSRLQRVIMETERSLSNVPTSATRNNMPLQGVDSASASPPSLASPVSVHTQLAMSPVLGSQKPTLQIQLPSSPIALKAVSDGFIHVDALHTHNPTEAVSGENVANPPPTSPIINTPQEPNGSISSSIPSKPQPKRTRRAELSEALIARDLDWFKSNRASVNDEDTGTSSSKAGEISLASDMIHIPERSPLSKKKTARIVPSRHPRRISLDVTQRVEAAISASTLPPACDPPAEETSPFVDTEDVSIRNIDQQRSFPERTESETRAAPIPDAHGAQDNSSHKELLSPKPEPAITQHNKSPITPYIPQTAHQFPSVKASLLNGESAVFRQPPTPPPQTELDRMESMDISTPDLASERIPSDPPFKPSTPPSPQLQLRGPILPPLVGAWEPPLNLNFKVSQISSDLPMDSNQRRFDGEMIVIHSAQGKSLTHTHMIDIALNESMFAEISKWAARRSHPSEAPHGVCVSLACYRLPEFFDKIKSGSGKPDIEALMLQTPCSWPNPDRLSLHISDKTRQTVITLSPPLFLTPDQCVDLSSLMKPGNNTLELRQQGDLSEYLIALHAHRPTRAQLAEFEVIKTADERWKLFLDALSARVMPGNIIGTNPASSVGVY